jgi:hypothetical protein
MGNSNNKTTTATEAAARAISEDMTRRAQEKRAMEEQDNTAEQAPQPKPQQPKP